MLQADSKADLNSSGVMEIHRNPMSPDEVSVWRKLVAIQGILTLGSLALGILRLLTLDAGHARLITLMIAGLVFAALPLFETAKDSELWRLGFLITQTAMLFLCSIVALPFAFVFFFVILAARASIILNGKMLIAAITLMLLAVVASAEIAVAMNLAPPPHHLPIAVQTISRIEFELSIVITICAVGFLSRKVVSEQRALFRAETLTREMQDMAVELERSRIARDMHDNLGHILTSLCIQLELTRDLQQQKKLDQSEQALLTASELAGESFDELRRAIQAIRDDFDLKESMTRLAQRIASQQKMRVEVDIDPAQLPISLRHDLFCMAQECLTNVLKHSQATEVSVQLKQLNGRIQLTVEDNGIGYRDDARAHGFGIVGMNDRAKRHGGSVKVERAKTRGTVVQIQIPT